MGKKTMFQFCKDNGINVMPIKLGFQPKINKAGKQEYLENGEKKQQKILECYGKMNWFKTEEGKAKIKNRWYEYNNGNYQGYNHFAWDTGGDFKAIDIDCMLPDMVEGVVNPFIALQEELPFKKSTTKSFGKHLIAKIPEVTDMGNRIQFPKKYGIDVKGDKGIELLNGQWAWSAFDAELLYHERTVAIVKELIDIKKALTEKPTITNDINNTIETFKKLQVQPKYEYLQNSILKYMIEHNSDDDVAKTAALVITCACSQDESVYKILRDILREGKNYSSDQWIRTTWDSYNSSNDDPKYMKRYLKYIAPKLGVNNFKIKFTQKAIAKGLIKLVKDDFIKVTGSSDYGYYWFNSETCLWKKLRTKAEVILRIGWRTEEIENIYYATLLDIQDSVEKAKFEASIDKIFGFHTPREMVAKYTYGLLSKLIKETNKIHFNQQESTIHLFQFNNG